MPSFFFFFFSLFLIPSPYNRKHQGFTAIGTIRYLQPRTPHSYVQSTLFYAHGAGRPANRGDAQVEGSIGDGTISQAGSRMNSNPWKPHCEPSVHPPPPTLAPTTAHCGPHCQLPESGNIAGRIQCLLQYLFSFLALPQPPICSRASSRPRLACPLYACTQTSLSRISPLSLLGLPTPWSLACSPKKGHTRKLYWLSLLFFLPRFCSFLLLGLPTGSVLATGTGAGDKARRMQ
jgi:hypothetical protein